jgi:uncharacterized protein
MTSSEARKGDWIQTYTGRRFYPLDPRPDEVDILDIAHALAQQCRFTGHTKTHYSVAQHSCLVSQHAGEADGLWGLLHDAAEAYISDLSRPVKQSIRAAGITLFDEIEDRIMVAVCLRYGLPPGPMPVEVNRADLLLLATEARDFMAPLDPGWYHTEANGWPVLPDRIVPWGPGRAEWAFRERFYGFLPSERTASSGDSWPPSTGLR